MNINETYARIQNLSKGDVVTVEGLVTNLTFTKGVREDLTFVGWFGPQPLFSREGFSGTIPFVAFQAGHVALV